MNVGNQKITLIRRIESGRDAHGNTIYAESREVVFGCSVLPAGAKGSTVSNEFSSGRHQVEEKWRLFAPAGTDLTSIDAVEYRNVRYEVYGDAQEWPDLRGEPDHVEAAIRRVTG